MSLLNDLYAKKEKLEWEVRLLKKEVSNAKRQQKKIADRVLSKKLEEEQLKGLLQIHDEEHKRKHTRKSIKPQIIPSSEEVSSRGDSANKRLPKSKNNEGIQETRGEDRPRKGTAKRVEKVVEREVDSGRPMVGDGQGDSLREGRTEKHKHKRMSSVDKNNERDAYYIKRTGRKAREEECVENSEGEGSESEEEGELE